MSGPKIRLAVELGERGFIAHSLATSPLLVGTI